MKHSKTTTGSAFSSRLRELMRARGHVSAVAKSGVDINALAEAAHISYEMARRYAEGTALPRPAKLEAIAIWLGVKPGALLYGETDESNEVNAEVLEACIKAAAEAQHRTGIALSTEKAARLVAMLYQEAREGRAPVQSSIDRLLNLIR